MYHRIPIAILVSILALSLEVKAQFPVTLRLDAQSAQVVTTPPTRTDAKYRITVEGTYSQWPQFGDCHGVDAVWVYDVPQEEIDAYRWPPKELLGNPFVEIPHWVGDTTEYAFPPSGFGIDPLFEISFRKYLGFRVNGEPLPATRLNNVIHRYQQERSGTGEPFRFQILDSTFNVALGRVIPRYEDNCGELVVTVEEILETDVNICDVQPIVVNGESIGIQIDAGVFVRDTSAADGRRNIYYSQDQLGIIDNGRFICPDSLVCDTGRTAPLSVGLIVDVSGSMSEEVVFSGKRVSRLDAVKSTLHNFLTTLQPGDSLFLLTFSSSIVISQDWTSDTAQLGAVIDQLEPLESTALHAAIIRGLDKVSSLPRDRGVMITLTDGLNNRDPIGEEPVIEAISKTNVPFYLVAFGFADTPAEQDGLQVMRRFVNAAPRGRLYEVVTGDELLEVYSELGATLETEDCCKLYFRIQPCDRGQTKRTLKLVYLSDNQLLSKEITVDCDLKVTSVSPDTNKEPTHQINMARPSPADLLATVLVTTTGPSLIQVLVFDVAGNIVAEKEQTAHDTGATQVTFSTAAWPNGLYLCRVWNGTSLFTTKIVVQH